MQEANLFTIFIEIFNKNELKYFITGSVASIVYGEPRLTHDIDLVTHMTPAQVEKFINAFPIKQFYCPPEEIIRTELNRHSRGHINLIHHETGFKADIYFTGEDEFQIWAMDNRRSVEFAGLTIYVAPPEYVIVKKLEFFKEGKSGKHLSDIKGIMTNSSELLDNEFLQRKISEFGLKDIWLSLR